jgi:uncharacterized SAM-binding protein YcdF (DUF218 family)
MAKTAFDDDNEEKPLDPAVERVRRKLVRFVAINLGILLVALMAVVAALVYRNLSRERAPEAPAELVQGMIALPSGARIVSQSLSGDRILIDAELSGGGRTLFVYDTAANRMVGRFDIGTE